MKKVDIYNVYALVDVAKLTKLEDGDKFKVIKACKVMKPIYEELHNFRQDTLKKLADENHDKMVEVFEEWRSNLKNPNDEQKKSIEYINEYNKKVDECLSEEFNKEVEVTWEKLSEDGLKKFVASNDWNVQQTIAVMGLFE
jgi:hypothetical protein